MEQFSLDKYLENTSRKIITRDGRTVRILDYNLKGDKHICIAVNDKTQESITTVDEDGHCLRDKTGWHETNFDLFFADEEEPEKSLRMSKKEALQQYEYEKQLFEQWGGTSIITFKEWLEIKSIVLADEEEELTEFEKELQIIISEASHWTSDDGSISTYCQFGDKEIKKISGQLLDLARKELETNYYTKVLDDRMVFKSDLHDRELQTAYDMGKQAALKDFPKWKKITEVKQNYLAYGYLSHDGYYLSIQELKDKLPKEE